MKFDQKLKAATKVGKTIGILASEGLLRGEVSEIGEDYLVLKLRKSTITLNIEAVGLWAFIEGAPIVGRLHHLRAAVWGDE